MSGAWESGGNTVLVAILTRELVSTAWASGLRKLILPGGAGITFKTGMPFDHARNSACRDALNNGFEWLFFLDDDVIPPPDVIPRLMAHKKEIVSGIYYRRSPPTNAPVMLNYQPDGSTQYIGTFKWPDLIPADLVGAGCLLINRRVLQALHVPGASRPWFEWMCDREDLKANERRSEDFEFCMRAKKAGFKVWVDTSVHCQHIGLGRSLIHDSKPEFIPVEIEP